MKELEILKSLLASNFQYSFYNDAILNVRSEIKEIQYYRENWGNVIRLIIYRKLTIGEPLNLIQETANLVLYENTDEEAYRWLDLFVINVLRQEEVIPYQINVEF